MIQFRRFHSIISTMVLLAAFCAATGITACAATKPSPDEDCDGFDTGTMTLESSLTVSSSTTLSACSTATDLDGIAAVTLQSARTGRPGKTKFGNIKLRVISVSVTDPTGATSTYSAVEGTLEVPTSARNLISLDVNGIVGPDGSLQLAIESKKGLNAVNVKKAFVASGSGSVQYNPKEYTLSTKSSYVGHVTIVK